MAVRETTTAIPVHAAGIAVRHGARTMLAPTSLRVEAGQAVALRGANGVGKTTMLRALAGEVAPTEGDLQVFGARPDARRSRMRARVASLLAPPPHARELTVLEHLALVAAAWGIAGRERTRRGLDALDTVGAPDIAQLFPHELSSGQRQAFALALAFTRPFELLLLDEPEQRLDETRRDRVASAVRDLVLRGAAVVFATHSTDFAHAAGARTVWLHQTHAE